MRNKKLSGKADYSYRTGRSRGYVGRDLGWIYKYTTQNVNKNELATVGLKFHTAGDITENDIRKEHGLRLRGVY